MMRSRVELLAAYPSISAELLLNQLYIVARPDDEALFVEGFRAAGFDVLGLLNEPSAASIEYMHRLGDLASKSGERILVYDLGGGTFDVSLVRHEAGDHEGREASTAVCPSIGERSNDGRLACLT